MKKIILLSLIAIGFVGMYSCKKLDELTKFNLEYKSSVTVPANSIVNLPLNLPTPDITTNSKSTFENNNTNKDLVQEIKLDKMNISVKAPQGTNLDFLKSVEVFISAEGLDEIRVASKYDIANGLTSLDLDYADINLKDYVLKESIKLRVKTITDEAVTQDRNLDILTRFWVNAKILGV